MTKRAWTIRPFEAGTDKGGWLKLWSGVAGFDGAVPARTAGEVDALLAHPAHLKGAHWRVAVAGNGAIVGALEVGYIGSVRTEVLVATNPAWRRQGIGRELMRSISPDRRLLVTTRGSAAGAQELLTAEGFTERYRESRMRRAAKGIEPLEIPDGAKVEVDTKRDVRRCIDALVEVYGDDAETDPGLVGAWLARPGCQALYLTIAHDSYGICLVAGSDRVKKAERTSAGEPTVGVIEKVGLSKAVRGKGMSRPLIRAGLMALAKAGFKDVEVLADQRKPSAGELYENEGFTAVDDDVHWMRKERAE